MRRKSPQPKATLETPYALRKVLVKQEEGCASMTMAKFVPWGIPLRPPGIRCANLGAYLGMSSERVIAIAKRLQMELYYDAPLLKHRKTCTRSKSKMVSEENAGRLVLYFRAREGRRLTREPRSSQATPPAESTAVSAPTR